ncbi:MAG: hypothetical protein BJ554DRAFT_797 [Olpidium bornovanus]|uniref:Uncharacterized protein n=1 Tax=Olpidium bornovanus TaxID=278681 RepID=A0A8H7ZT05_9FUNG|nr:MAG: hypothetical protein BJ554DRAFT_797 [Olpidium bornovanus]
MSPGARRLPMQLCSQGAFTGGLGGFPGEGESHPLRGVGSAGELALHPRQNTPKQTALRAVLATFRALLLALRSLLSASRTPLLALRSLLSRFPRSAFRCLLPALRFPRSAPRSPLSAPRTRALLTSPRLTQKRAGMKLSCRRR